MNSMLNLYWKIFLGFWLTGLVLGGGAILVSQQLHPKAPLEIRGLSPSELVNRTSFIIRRIPEELNDWQTRLGENDIFLYIDTSSSNSLASTIPPAEITKLFAALDPQATVERSSFMRLSIGKLEKSPSGGTIKYAIDMPSITLFRLRQLSEQLIVQILLALAISTAACFIMARYLTRNLKQISEASRQLAEGNFDARMQITNHAAKDELTVLAEDFNLMADSVQAGIENQKRLVRDISHELRSPLARLQIALELARQSGSDISGDSQQQQNNAQALDRIETEANRLNEMIGQLLAIPDKNASLDDTVELGELITAILDDNQIEANNKQASFSFTNRIEEALVRANATQLHSALENIIRNAIHYTDECSSIEITIEREEVNCAATGNKKKDSPLPQIQFRITVTDNGPGVPKDDLETIFEPFYRVDRARNRKTGGYGIGLAIVHRVINGHRGQVIAKNSGHGLSVEVVLPELTDF
ncbi:ATP-binding protein [Pseudomonadales bacterium]|nr:ATP-binding protein [bacterium]MDB4806441.1 ATP-binding protein [Pseudomonadales bacterium]